MDIAFSHPNLLEQSYPHVASALYNLYSRSPFPSGDGNRLCGTSAVVKGDSYTIAAYYNGIVKTCTVMPEETGSIDWC
ncbi:MAG: hypothetical protein MJ106_02295, partial [Lentisphaeria bacterium]|nr:hypothetical protein [Lentisphaeria bacterium]